MRKAIAIVMLLTLAIFATSAFALDIPKMINFQGHISDAGGPINGELEINFKIYDAASAGITLWAETRTVTAADGVYSVELGETSPIDIEFDGDLWLGVQVTGQSEMSPRYRLLSVPFAYVAQTADSSRTVSYDAIDSSRVLDGSLSLFDLASGGATSGQTMKWTGLEWAPAADLGSGSTGWIDDGNYVRLANVYDSVGIGTATPMFKLHVVGLSLFDVGTGSIGISTPGGWPGMICYSTNGDRRDIVFDDDRMMLLASPDGTAPEYDHGITISDNGRVGIDTFDPQETFHVVGSGRFDVGDGQFTFSTPGGWPGMICYSPGGERRDIILHDDGLRLLTSSDGTAPALTSGILIENNGNVNIGYSGGGSYKLDVNGNIQCVSLTQTSDARLKRNIQPLHNVLDRVMQLDGVSFDWNQAADPDMNLTSDHQIGLIAQEVEKVFPELVSSPEDGYKSVDYSQMTAVLLQAIKELSQQNQQLQKRLDAIEIKSR